MKLNEFLASMEEGEKVMVFVNKKSRCDDIASDLCIKGTSCQSIHGDREQSDREQAIDDLRTGEVSILIATDVASRPVERPMVSGSSVQPGLPKGMHEWGMRTTSR